MALHISDGLLCRKGYDRVVTFSCGGMSNVDLVLSEGKNDADAFGVSDMSVGSIVNINAHSYSHTHHISHTIELDSTAVIKLQGFSAIGTYLINICLFPDKVNLFYGFVFIYFFTHLNYT